MQLGFDSLQDVLNVVVVPVLLGFLALYFPRRWQFKQLELKIKSELVADISKLVMEAVTTIDIVNKYKNQTMQTIVDEEQLQRLDETYKKLEVDCCVLRSKIHAYFPSEKKDKYEVHDKWGDFSKKFIQYYERKRAHINNKKS